MRGIAVPLAYIAVVVVGLALTALALGLAVNTSKQTEVVIRAATVSDLVKLEGLQPGGGVSSRIVVPEGTVLKVIPIESRAYGGFGGPAGGYAGYKAPSAIIEFEGIYGTGSKFSGVAGKISSSGLLDVADCKCYNSIAVIPKILFYSYPLGGNTYGIDLYVPVVASVKLVTSKGVVDLSRGGAVQLPAGEYAIVARAQPFFSKAVVVDAPLVEYVDYLVKQGAITLKEANATLLRPLCAGLRGDAVLEPAAPVCTCGTGSQNLGGDLDQWLVLKNICLGIEHAKVTVHYVLLDITILGGGSGGGPATPPPINLPGGGSGPK